MSFDPFAEFAQFAPQAPAFQPPAPAPAPQQPTEKKSVMNNYQQQAPMQQQQQQVPMQQNPLGMSYGAPPAMSMNQQPMVPVHQQSNQWSMQQQQQQQQPHQNPFGMGMPMQHQPQAHAPVPVHVPAHMAPAPSYNSYAPPAPAPAPSQMTPNGYPQQQQQQQMNNTMVSSPAQSYYSGASTAPPAPVPQQPFAQQAPPQQQQMAPNPPQQQQQQQAPVPQRTAPAAVIQEDDDFFGAFSNTVPSPSRPPSVFEANENDDVSYLSKSTGGGTEKGTKYGPLDDPKFAPKPPAVHGLANAQSLSQHAPPGASPLPNFEEVMHSGYVLSRISFRTILIKKWKQTFWVSYGKNQILFFRSSADFEDWISNPYLSQGQRDFLVKLRVDFVEDLYKQNVRGYQATNLRLKNYNNKMLHQFKLERWMDYGPTIAAAFASPNEKECFNLRTIISEMMKRAPQGGQGGGAVKHAAHQQMHNAGHGNEYDGRERPATSHGNYGSPEPMAFAAGGGRQLPPAQNFTSSASLGRMDYGRGAGASVYSQNSNRSYGVMSAGPVERSRDPVNTYSAGYRVQTQVGSNGRY